MSNKSYRDGQKDSQQGKGAPSPSSFPSSTQRESYDAGRAAQKRKEEDDRRKKK